MRSISDFSKYPNLTRRKHFDDEKDYLLFIAVVKGELDSILHLIAEGANPHTKHQIRSMTAVHAALREKDSDRESLEKIKALLKNVSSFPNDLSIYSLKISNIELEDYDPQESHTPICLAIQQGKQQCVEFLLSKQANYITCTSPDCPGGPLSQAVRLNSKPATQSIAYNLITLLTKSANDCPQSIYAEAFTTLPQAVAYLTLTLPWSIDPYYTTTRKIAGLLLKKIDNNPNIPDANGCIALHYAVLWRPSLVPYLIKKGSHLDYQNKEGDTPLHELCRAINRLVSPNDDIDIDESLRVRLQKEAYNTALELLKAGTNLNIKNHKAETALQALLEDDRQFIQYSLSQHRQTLIRTCGLDQPDRTGDLLDEKTQKMAADLWRRLGKRNQIILCSIFNLEHPKQTAQHSNLDSYLEKVFAYLPKTFLDKLDPSFKHSTPSYSVPRLPNEIKLSILEALFKNKLAETDNIHLASSVTITPNGLLSILIRALTEQLPPLTQQNTTPSPSQAPDNCILM